MSSKLPAMEEIDARLKKLKEEAFAIWQDELALKAREKLGKENVRGEIYRLMEREEKCFKEIRAARTALRDICGHANRKWIGQAKPILSDRDWFCLDCGKVQAETRTFEPN